MPSASARASSMNDAYRSPTFWHSEPGGLSLAAAQLSMISRRSVSAFSPGRRKPRNRSGWPGSRSWPATSRSPRETDHPAGGRPCRSSPDRCRWPTRLRRPERWSSLGGVSAAGRSRGPASTALDSPDGIATKSIRPVNKIIPINDFQRNILVGSRSNGVIVESRAPDSRHPLHDTIVD